MCKFSMKEFEHIVEAGRAGNCGKVKCNGGKDDSCSVGIGLPFFNCPEGDCVLCQKGYTCLDNSGSTFFSGKCFKEAGLGDSCQNDDQCYDGRYKMECLSGKCEIKKTGNLATKDKCESGSDCKSGTCTDGLCAAIALGGVCLSDKACANDAYCNIVTGCTARNSEKGGTCLKNDMCKLFTETCEGGRCVERGVVGKGGAAEDDEQCKDGLREEGGKCVEVDYSKTTACGTLNTCKDSHMTCVCDTVDPEKGPLCIQTDSTCEGSEAAFRECLQKNDCNADSSPRYKGSCADEKCGSAYKAVISCARGQFKESYGTVFSGQCVSSLVGSASPLEATIGLLF